MATSDVVSQGSLAPILQGAGLVAAGGLGALALRRRARVSKARPAAQP